MSRDVETVGTVTDLAGREVRIGTDHDAVTIGEYRFSRQRRDDLMRLLEDADYRADVHDCGAE
jgi:hypothetical protein